MHSIYQHKKGRFSYSERYCRMKNPTAVCCRFYVFSLLLFVFRGSRLAPSEVYRVIALLAPALTPRALKCGLLSPRSDQHLYSLSALGFNFGLDAFTNERNHWWAFASWLHWEKRVEESLVDYRATWGWSTNIHAEAAAEGAACASLPCLGYWHSLLVLCLISLK